MTGEEELHRGQHAAQVLANPIYQEANERLVKEVVDRWQKEADPKAREQLWMLVQACHKVKKIMEEVMVTGKLRQKSIAMEQGRIERLGKALRRS